MDEMWMKELACLWCCNDLTWAGQGLALGLGRVGHAARIAVACLANTPWTTMAISSCHRLELKVVFLVVVLVLKLQWVLHHDL